MRLKVTALLLSTLAIQGCGVIYPAIRSESKLSQIELGQSRKEVISTIGSPDVVRESKNLDNGKTLEIDEYRLYPPYEWLRNAAIGPFVLTLTWWVPLNKNSHSYLVRYIDGKIDHWDKEKNWQGDLSVDMTTGKK